MLGTYHLTVLYDVLKDLHFLYQPEKIHSLLLEGLMKALDADAASIFMADPKEDKLRLAACLGSKKSTLEVLADELVFPVGNGICGWVAQYNQPTMVEDAQKDPRFNPQPDALTGYKTKSILAAPIASRNKVIGVIEILNKKSSIFNKNDLDLVAFIARQAAIALENARLYTELESTRNFDESVLSNLSGGFISIDLQKNVTHLNPAAENILKLFAFESVGKSSEEVLKQYPDFHNELSHTLSSGEGKKRQEFTCERPDKTQARIGFSTFAIQDASKKALGSGIIFQDLTALKD